MLTKSSASLLFIGSIAISYQLQLPTVLYSLLIVLSLYYLVTDIVYDQIKDYLLPSASKDYKENLQRLDHDERRSNTYPELIPNTWYHLCDSDEIKVNEVKEIRMLKQVFAVWRDSKGGIVCQEAFCLHLGANLAVGGKIVDDCIECPFHRWKFSNDGTIVNIPYINNPTHCPTNKKLKTFHCVEWNGLICVYYHADDEPPAFSMPEFITNELRDGNWKPHLKWDLGFTTLSVIDWVDQAGDHAHFHTLHADMLIPWTTFPIPQLILDWFPISIKHNVTTYRGDDKEWSEKNASTGQNRIDKHLMFFTDYVGITWAGKPMMSTFSETLEMFCGPAIMVFHIPFTIGAFKVFVTTTPTDGGSVMRVRTWIDGRTNHYFYKKQIAWLLSGISASQLYCDIQIMANKIRMRKPMLQPFDGPYNRVNSWLKQFYSPNSGKTSTCKAYKNDW